MKREIRFSGLSHSLEDRDFVERRIDFTLSRFADRIDRVSTTIRDENGPRGGIDQRCQVVVHANGVPQPITVDILETDWRIAVTEAYARLGRTLRRRFEQMGNRRNRTAFDGSPYQRSST